MPEGDGGDAAHRLEVSAGDEADLLRTNEVWRSIQDRLCTDREALRWGVSYLDREFPQRYDSNHLFIDRPDDGISVEALHAECERIQGGAGLEHREVQVTFEEVGRRLAMGFVELGYGAERILTMALRRPPSERVDTSGVERVDFAAARPGLERVAARGPGVRTPEIVRRLTDFGAKLERAIGARFLVARVEGQIASLCELYVVEGAAQVENVNTLEEHRGRGLAKAVVSAAVDEALADGCGFVYLFADADDWPQHLYRRLGFETIGATWEFLRPPGGQGPASR